MCSAFSIIGNGSAFSYDRKASDRMRTCTLGRCQCKRIALGAGVFMIKERMRSYYE